MKLSPFTIILLASISVGLIFLTFVVVCIIHFKRRSKQLKDPKEPGMEKQDALEMQDLRTSDPERVPDPAMRSNMSRQPLYPDPYMQATAPRASVIYPSLQGLQ